ncbi:MAG: hypothetical protein JKY67_09785 [Pseudomonadales bacterium]|nr:hypothetical protein [Pseudomonadales bacterium]
MPDDMNRECVQFDDPEQALLAQLAEDMEWLSSSSNADSNSVNSGELIIDNEGEIEVAKIEEVDLLMQEVLASKITRSGHKPFKHLG